MNKSLENLDMDTLPKLYTTLVHQHLEYGNAIWGPFYKLDKKSLEQIQRRATQIMLIIPNYKTCHIQRVGHFRLPTLYL